MGTSLAILHTEKAEEIWEEVKGELFWFSCEREDLLQPRLTGPTPAAEGRTRFMERYASPFSSLVELTFQPPQPPEKSPPQIEPPEESPQIEPPEEPSPQIEPPEEASPQIETPEEPPQIEPPEEPPEEAPPQIEPPPEARPEPPEEPPARRTGGADRMTLLGRIKRRQFLFFSSVKTGKRNPVAVRRGYHQHKRAVFPRGKTSCERSAAPGIVGVEKADRSGGNFYFARLNAR